MPRDAAIWDHMCWDYFRWDVIDLKASFDRMLTQQLKVPAQAMGGCAPAVFDHARFAGTLASGATLRCRFDVNRPEFDAVLSEMKKQ